MGRMAVALIHHPVYDRAKNTIATNITNFDIHDIARACRVYDIEKYYIIHPMREQLMFVSRVLDHWRVGSGSKFNPDAEDRPHHGGNSRIDPGGDLKLA